MKTSAPILDFTKHPDSARRLKALLDEAIRQKKAQTEKVGPDSQAEATR